MLCVVVVYEIDNFFQRLDLESVTPGVDLVNFALILIGVFELNDADGIFLGVSNYSSISSGILGLKRDHGTIVFALVKVVN